MGRERERGEDRGTTAEIRGQKKEGRSECVYRRRPDRRINIHWLERPQYAERRGHLELCIGKHQHFPPLMERSRKRPHPDSAPLKLNANSVIKRLFPERSRNRKGSQVAHVSILPGDGAPSVPRSDNHAIEETT